MENATKALIIAASVLIVIVIIAVGIKILGSTQGVTDEVGKVSDAMGQSVFNSQFESYTGRQSAAQVKSVVNKAAATHSAVSSRKVNVKFMNESIQRDINGITNILSKLNDPFYNVSINLSVYTGYVELITITAAS